MKISGFPEWLPEQKIVEDDVISKIKKVYASYGFAPIETPAVELTSTLTSKGVIDKEIYVLKRAKAADDSTTDKEELALHFDLTVPFARYTAQHLNELTFPFKRYQLQKVWRGERPQKGRFREFYQFDIDIIARENLPLAADAEIISAIHDALTAAFPVKFLIRINNRKLLHGAYEALGIEEQYRPEVISIVDKLDKLQKDGIKKLLEDTKFLTAEQIDKIISLTDQNGEQVIELLKKEFQSNKLLEEGLSEITELTLSLSHIHEKITVDLSLARGLDYYTGTVFEVVLPDYPAFGTISGGGRYENLAGQFTSQKLPGVGASIGLTRLMDLVFKENLIPTNRKSLVQAFVTVLDKTQRPKCNKVARELRTNNINCEVSLSEPKLGKQIEYAESKGAKFVFFVSDTGIEAKDLSTKQQTKVENIKDWCDLNMVK